MPLTPKTISLRVLLEKIIFLSPELRERLLTAEPRMPKEVREKVIGILEGLHEKELQLMTRLQKADPDFLNKFSTHMEESYRSAMEQLQHEEGKTQEHTIQKIETDIHGTT